ncbi:MAG: DUF5915 domain-containing protein, partial [Cryomorphaceae bacterium]|nr:DUF5915 domain-containing protein [Cryomorphaceae bacterium]
WLVAVERGLTVALDVDLSDDLKREGVARELVNRIQNMRKDSDFDVTDRIVVHLQNDAALIDAISHFEDYIKGEVLANSIQWHDQLKGEEIVFDEVTTVIEVVRA